MNSPAYNIGDDVYHITPESPKGKVINITYHFLTKHFEYQVSFSAETISLWYYEHELQNHKSYN